MQIYHIALLQYEQNKNILTKVIECTSVSIFSFFHKKRIKEILDFVTSTLSDNVQKDQLITINDPDFSLHVQSYNSIFCLIVTDREYPRNVCHRLIDKIICLDKDSLNKTHLTELLNTYQDPTKADNIFKVKEELKTVHEVLLQNIDKVLERRAHISELIDKTNILSESSKTFLKRSKKQNRTCTLLSGILNSIGIGFW